MRRKSVVATAALIAALALAGMPGPAGSRSPSAAEVLAPAAFTSVVVPADAPAQRASGSLDSALRSASYIDASGRFTEPGAAPTAPTKRPKVTQPAAHSGEAWKTPKYTISGYATFYNSGTTAMRLPRGTVVRRQHRAHRHRLWPREEGSRRGPVPPRLLQHLRLPRLVGEHMGHGLDLLIVGERPTAQPRAR